MAFQTQDGTKSYGSKFRASRYDRENAPTDPGPRSQANKLEGKTGSDADSRLHNNPHAEKFNTPLHGPKPSAEGSEPGEEQAESREQHTVKCPECGADVSVGSETTPHDNGPSETEQDVQDDKVAKGVWKPGQREHPDADFDPDFEPSIL